MRLGERGRRAQGSRAGKCCSETVTRSSVPSAASAGMAGTVKLEVGEREFGERPGSGRLKGDGRCERGSVRSDERVRRL